MSVRITRAVEGRKYYWYGVLKKHDTYTERWWTADRNRASILHPMDADIMMKGEFRDLDVEVEYIEIGELSEGE